MVTKQKVIAKGEYQYGFNDGEQFSYRTPKGLSEEVVRDISSRKHEPEWMLQFRLKSLRHFLSRPLPSWGPDLSALNFDEIHYYVDPGAVSNRSWEEMPPKIRNTFERLGIPEAERKYLSGVSAQYESESVHHSILESIAQQGVFFSDCDTGLREHGDIFRKYFSTVVPPNDNKFAALNSAVWSGGTFIYVPPGIKVTLPLQAYFRINSKAMGQFERTLIIADKGSEVTYLEACSSPVYTTNSLHSAVVELIALEDATIRYQTIQNWSDDVYNLVTKRAIAHRNAYVEWDDANMGSKVTAKYPSVYLIGEGATGKIISAAFAATGQHIDSGGKCIHVAPNTKSTIIAKSISQGEGRTSYRGHLKIYPTAKGSKSNVRCDALLLNEEARTDTYPYMDVEAEDVELGHEATVSKIGDEQLFYAQTRGISEVEAATLIVNGFLSEFTNSLPMEYALEFTRLIELQMEGSVG